KARRARPHRAAEGRRLPRARLPAGERDPAGLGAGQGRAPGETGGAAGGLGRVRVKGVSTSGELALLPLPAVAGRGSAPSPPQRTSQRLESSSVAGLRLIQLAAAK